MAFSFCPMSMKGSLKKGVGLKILFFFFGMILASPSWALDYTVTSKTVVPVPELPLPFCLNKLPDGEVLTFKGGKSEIWLSHPTKRYAHGVLGDSIEAGGITYSHGKAPLLLEDNAVFEDRVLRPVDLDKDGLPEFIVVKSYLDKGAALAAVSLISGSPQIMAETDPIGLSHRWLNPVGIADFDGDGEPEVAAVITPHIGGTLKLYGFRDGKLFLKYAKDGFSNHAYGSRELGLSTIGDLDGDGIVELFIPDAKRQDIRVVSFKGKLFRELARIKSADKITGPLKFLPGETPQLTYSLINNKQVTITFTP